ncbi:hypothetical protein AT2G40745 [Arabidopsis thaliana]|uniref:Uncharacterized protein At2g40745/T7D17.20 n=1 Tax=Arabidopsis thaliana TaxID=3702 RepID=Q84X46_ARATH|nr:uncharacterized protein AT2G40745 [Arabidopsis thaliana]AAO37144.1 hypothetical protein [Arabidopsis thaliana]AAX55152.1 hypothetical protein At2g40745 [Arabidopsis thaliana]AEC09873.1 hypothetical protein AT2G40745 [Arabidopsis thaliana]|eukprot:NP_850334.1 hypothetical protein AT2G40745 [Arabidopsis thaliana]
MRGKKIIITGEDVKLLVNIFGTIGVTNGRPYQYKVEAWTNENEKHETKVVATEGDPEFDEELQLFQDQNFPVESLYVDVFKTNSTGTYFVGRRVTLLPTVKGVDFYREVNLSGPEETGFLQLSLTLMEFEILGYVPS